MKTRIYEYFKTKNIFDILGIAIVDEEDMADYVENLSTIILQRAIKASIEDNVLTQEKLDELEKSINDPVKLQEEIIKSVPNIQEYIEKETFRLKIELMIRQLTDFGLFVANKPEVSMNDKNGIAKLVMDIQAILRKYKDQVEILSEDEDQREFFDFNSKWNDFVSSKTKFNFID